MAFRFKQFTVNDERSTLKVGTDAVLLGSWAGHKDAENILDIGTGCGLLSLMLAQRFPGSGITATTSTTGPGGIYIGYREQRADNSLTRPPTLDDFSITEVGSGVDFVGWHVRVRIARHGWPASDRT